MTKTKLASLFIIAILGVISTGLAFAQTPDNSTSSVLSPITIGGVPVLKWAIGLIWAGVGYAVARNKGETFDPLNFASTIVIGIIVAGLTSLGSLSPDAQLALVAVLTPILDKLFGKRTSTTVTTTNK